MENTAITKEGEFQSAKNALQALEYERVDEAFLEKHQRELEIINDYLENVGGIFVLTVDEYDVICRLPSHEVYENVASKQGLSGFETDRMLLGKSLIYPSMNTINEWAEKTVIGGIVQSFVRKILIETKASQEVRSKKLFFETEKELNEGFGVIELLSYRYNLPQLDSKENYPKRAAQLKYLTEREINITASAIAKVLGG